jgi:hypothetical protein
VSFYQYLLALERNQCLDFYILVKDNKEYAMVRGPSQGPQNSLVKQVSTLPVRKGTVLWLMFDEIRAHDTGPGLE